MVEVVVWGVIVCGLLITGLSVLCLGLACCLFVGCCFLVCLHACGCCIFVCGWGGLGLGYFGFVCLFLRLVWQFIDDYQSMSFGFI